MIALGYGISYIWGTVGIILICKYLPKWWGVDARKAAEEYEKAARSAEPRRRRHQRIPRRAGSAPTVWRTSRLPARRSPSFGKRIRSTASSMSCAAVSRWVRAPISSMQLGDVVALGGRLEDLTANMGLLGTEVPDAKALAVPLDQAEILVTNKSVEGRELKEFRHEEFAGQLQVVKMERGRRAAPRWDLDTKLQRLDVLYVVGLKSAVEKLATRWARWLVRARGPTC